MSSPSGAVPLLVVKFRPSAWVAPSMLALVGIFGGMALAALGVLHGVDAGMLFGGAALMTFGVLMALLSWSLTRGRLELYEWGLERTTAFGSARLPFAEVESVTLPANSQIGVEPLSRCAFRGAGKKVSMGLLPAAETLRAAEFAVDRIVPRLARDLHSRLKAGSDAHFGKIRATTDGLGIGGKTVPWNEVERMNFSPEGLRIFPRNHPEATVILKLSTPNLHVLIFLSRLFASEAPAPASAPPAPFSGSAVGERVGGFADQDPQLGAIVCGISRARAMLGVAFAFLIFAALALITLAWFPWPVCAVLVAVILAGGVWRLFAAGFAVYENGVRTPKRQARWDEIDHVTYSVVDNYKNGAYTGRTVGLTLQAPQGKLSFSGGGARNEGVCNAVLDRLLPVMLERKWKELQGGATIACDKLQLTRDRISWKGDAVPYSMVSGHEPRKGFLHVWRTDKPTSWAMVSMGAQDARVVMHLLARLRQESSGTAQQTG